VCVVGGGGDLEYYSYICFTFRLQQKAPGRKEWKNYSTLQSNIQTLLRINLWCNSPWSNNQIVIPWTKCVIPSWAWAKFVTPRTFHVFFFIHGDNKVPFQTVLEIYICVFIFDRSCVLLKTKY
jgi:hypothetical protein